MQLPEKFSVSEYNNWYNKKFKVKVNLLDEVEKLKTVLSQRIITPSRQDINYWEQIRSLVDTALNQLSLTEYSVLPALPSNSPQLFAANFMKPTNSILNKMWRITRGQKNPMRLSTLTKRMNDLVRFSIRANSLKDLVAIAAELKKFTENPKDNKYKAFWKSTLQDAWMDSEMKTATGYFAYHFYFKLKIGIIIEMQIYSILSDSWRTLSHKLYERIRDDRDIKYDFNDVYSRIISIGHLLYLADCELYNLEKELKTVLGENSSV